MTVSSIKIEWCFISVDGWIKLCRSWSFGYSKQTESLISAMMIWFVFESSFNGFKIWLPDIVFSVYFSDESRPTDFKTAFSRSHSRTLNVFLWESSSVSFFPEEDPKLNFVLFLVYLILRTPGDY